MELADALVEGLLALDVRHVFGVSGANIEHLHDAIHRLGRGRLTSVLAKREDGAACMADYFGRVSRRLGVCCATSGGGMMNLVAGVAEAYQSSVPLLAIVGQPPKRLEGRGAFQDSSGIGRTVDAVRMFSALTKFTRRVDDPMRFWENFEDAVVAALEGRPGPSALLFPRSIFVAQVPDRVAEFVASVNARVHPREARLDELRDALELVRQAQAPVMLVGQGAQRTRNRQALFEFARAIDIPVATTMGARGEFPNDHPNYLGVVGMAGHPSVHDFIRDRCDLLLLAGCSLDVMTRGPFLPENEGNRPQSPPRSTLRSPRDELSSLVGKQMVAISADLGELRRSLSEPLTCAIEADLGATFERLHQLLNMAPFKVPSLGCYVQESFVSVPAPSPASVPAPPASGVRENPLLQSLALESLSQYLPEKGAILYDAGNCAAAALHMLSVPPGVTSVIALGMGAMGYGIAGAVGAQLGSPPGSRTMVFAGDGAFLTLGQEIHTAVDLALPILFVIFNNAMHGMCVTRQNRYFESRYEAVSYSRVDIAEVSRGFGSEERLWVGKAHTLDELEALMNDFMRNPMRTGVLELVLTVEEIPPFIPCMPANSETRPTRESFERLKPVAADASSESPAIPDETAAELSRCG
ncbi:thiamine pyrophosphate-binding protein [Pendulispora brunnea]|uniref:Thiamine pyrophosphate-binding protein n=1 Tax=Pendulispora brunnea TaxID=2905690 RepID=A0ABZ2KI42_9BACT